MTKEETTENDTTVEEDTDVTDPQTEVIDSETDEQDNAAVEPEETEELTEVQALQQKCEKLSEQLKRTAAEFQNFRKQIEKHRADDRRFTTCSVIRSLLPVVDGFDAAISASDAGQDAEQVVVGIKMVHGLLQQFFSDSQITTINPIDAKFDPLHHEAVQTEQTDDAAPGTILHVIQAGYSLNDLVIRHARVCVSEEVKEPEPTSSAPDDED